MRNWKAAVAAAALGWAYSGAGAAAEPWSDPAGRLSFNAPTEWTTRQEVGTAPTHTYTYVITGDASNECHIMAQPNPGTAAASADAVRRAFYGWLIGRPYDVAALPAEIATFEAWKADRSLPLPRVPFEWLTAFALTAENWAELSKRIGWQALRMNLNTLARNGAFDVAGVTDAVATRLADGDAIAKVRPMPYQLMVALGQAGEGVPLKVQAKANSA